MKQIRISSYSLMCKGANPERAKHHQDLADYHQMMAKFYRLDEHSQRIFMAAFEAMCDDKKALTVEG